MHKKHSCLLAKTTKRALKPGKSKKLCPLYRAFYDYIVGREKREVSPLENDEIAGETETKSVERIVLVTMDRRTNLCRKNSRKCSVLSVRCVCL